MKIYRITRIREMTWRRAQILVREKTQADLPSERLTKNQETDPYLRNVVCTVVEAGTSYELPHVPYNSPTGLEIGYRGAGPRDMALSILADYFEISPERGDTTDNLRASVKARAKFREPLKHHWNFAAEFIVPMKLKVGQSREITKSEIREWLATRGKKPN